MDDKGFLTADRGKYLSKEIVFNDEGLLKIHETFFCLHEMEDNYDPDTGWTGSVFCKLPKHAKGTTHIGFMPSGKVREWRDLHGKWSGK